MSGEELNPSPGMSRRQLIKRSAIVGGTVMWAAPMIQSLTSPAAAASAACPPCTGVCLGPIVIPFVGTFHITCDIAADSCACLCCCAGIAAGCATCSAPGTCPPPSVTLVNCSPTLVPGPC
jgi:hypothetical protein